MNSKCTIPLTFAVAMVALAPAEAGASQVFFRPFEDVAENIQVVLKVKITRADKRSLHLKLKSGKQGPVHGREVRYTADVSGVVYGPWVGKAKRISWVFSRVFPMMYNDQGKIVGHFSPIYSTSGIEGAMVVGQQYLWCLCGASGSGKDHRVCVVRAEETKRAKKVREVMITRAPLARLLLHTGLSKDKALATALDPQQKKLAVLMRAGKGQRVYLVSPGSRGVRASAELSGKKPFSALEFKGKRVVLTRKRGRPLWMKLSGFRPVAAAVKKKK